MPAVKSTPNGDTRQTSEEIREALVYTLQLDLIGPWRGSKYADECLPGWGLQRPSEWYLTGFLVPSDTPAAVRADDDADDDFNAEVPGRQGVAEESTQGGKRAKRVFFPSSMGLSFLVRPDAKRIRVTVTWGDYRKGERNDWAGRPVEAWARTPRAETEEISLGGSGSREPRPVSGSGGLVLHTVERAIPTDGLDEQIEPGTRAVSVFLVNDRPHAADRAKAEETYAFQAELSVECDRSLPPATGPLGAARAKLGRAGCARALCGHARVRHGPWSFRGLGRRRRRMPAGSHHMDRKFGGRGHQAASRGRRRTVHAQAGQSSRRGIRQGGAAAVGSGVSPLDRGREEGLGRPPGIAPRNRRRTAPASALCLGSYGAGRGGAGCGRGCSGCIPCCQPRGPASALATHRRRRPGVAPVPARLPAPESCRHGGCRKPRTEDGRPPLFSHRGREDGGLSRARGLCDGAPATSPPRSRRKSRCRRERDHALHASAAHARPAIARLGAGVCARARTRREIPGGTAKWPFEIGLWVGKAATPNKMGSKGDPRGDTARRKTFKFQSNPRANPAPIPVESCPWCQTRFTGESFSLLPDADRPSNLRVVCTNFECDFSGDRPLPIIGVDEPLYRRLPAFLIATVDKFASLPWEGSAGALLGRADRYDTQGFYGPAAPGLGTRLEAPLLPPDLVIQDELHLITGPLGTMMGLYETAIEGLCTAGSSGEESQTQDRCLYCDGAKGVGPGPGRLRACGYSGVSPAGARPAGLVLRGNGPSQRGASAPLSGDRGSRPEPKGSHEARPAAPHGRGAEAVHRGRRVRRLRTPVTPT